MPPRVHHHQGDCILYRSDRLGIAALIDARAKLFHARGSGGLSERSETGPIARAATSPTCVNGAIARLRSADLGTIDAARVLSCLFSCTDAFSQNY